MLDASEGQHRHIVSSLVYQSIRFLVQDMAYPGGLTSFKTLLSCVLCLVTSLVVVGFVVFQIVKFSAMYAFFQGR